MSDSSPRDLRVALVAADAGSLAALQAARQTLETFAVGWRDEMCTGGRVGAFDATGLWAIIVASADGVLPGALAAMTRLPVIRVPIADEGRGGIDLLYDPATANLPAGDTAFATVAIGEAGAKNAALLVVSMLGLNDARLWDEWLAFRQRQTDAVLAHAPLTEP